MAVLWLSATPAVAQTYDVQFLLTLTPAKREAIGSITLSREAKLVKRMTFTMPSPRYEVISADGELRRNATGVVWLPSGKTPTLRYKVQVDSRRKNNAFDNLYTKNWVIFRGDDVFPAAAVLTSGKASSVSTLRVDAPKHWNIDTAYPIDHKGGFLVNNPTRRFDRPTGWMIAGEVGTRREMVGATELSVAAPKGESMRRMDLLALLAYNLPEMKRAFGSLPSKLLIVGAPDPMWRGGLSGPNSLYLHLSRPMISENGTSPILHELVHSVTRVRGKKNGDFVAEGLAEFYSIELLRRSGGTTDARFDRTRAWLLNWGKDVKKLDVAKSTGKVTARAVVLLMDLDKEIRKRTDNEKSIDDVARLLIARGKVDKTDLRSAAKKVIGADSTVLATSLLQ